MNPSLTSAALAFLSLALFANAAPDYDRQVEVATEKRDKAVAQASEPINRDYLTTLQDLMKKATAAGDLEAALKIKTVIESVDPKGRAGRLLGDWLDGSKSSRLQFTAAGVFKEIWGGKVQEGRFKNKTSAKAEVELNNGSKYEYVLSEDGTSLKRSNDGMTWFRAN
jgi:hypothetical protein